MIALKVRMTIYDTLLLLALLRRMKVTFKDAMLVICVYLLTEVILEYLQLQTAQI